ncbi:uncharacterized protein LOC141670398 isoform X1 [Apium graveolens]|uniref:uncharacterized protein LOC141670398 isoform X1 n=1 Tax=Apium graveolens TaxID=4045 RepID=UPI003D7AD4B5
MLVINTFILSQPSVLAEQKHIMKKLNFLAVLLHSLVVCLAVTDFNSTTDRDALLAIKSRISSDPLGILATNWSSSTNICFWHGVYCSRDRVVSLNLHNMGLKGTIAPHIGNLSYLTSLDIGQNKFYGRIPEELAQLHSLKSLYLDYNEFNGDIFSSFGGLYNLRDLHLENNNFTGVVPPSIGNVSKLEVLNMSFNFLQGRIPEDIGKLSSLKHLSLMNNQLYGSLPLAMFNMSSLQTIELPANKLSDTLGVGMCDRLPQLQRLNLSQNNFYGQIPSAIKNCQKLQYLSLADNGFNGSIPREIWNVTTLKSLNLGYNQFQGEVPTEVGNLINLQDMCISNCFLTGLSPMAFNISSLRTIDFSNNSLSGSLPDHMIDYEHSNLKEIYLKSNHFTGRIPSSLWKLRSLEILSLSYNGWTGSMPNEIGNLTMLKYLSLGATNLTGVIPDEIGRLINLKELNLHEGRFSGLLPHNLFNISTIEIIDLYRNEFYGHIPSSMGNWLPNLKSLVLSFNNFSGRIPESTKNASKLVILNLSSNSFSGSIPNNLGDLVFLERLLLGLNNLTGEYFSPEMRFLTSLTNCRNLKLLVIALNPIGGFLPASLGNFSSSLQLIQAFGSKIRGNIPIGVGNLSGLLYLGLDQNELTGPIPSTIGRLHNLEVLYLEQNKLKGYLPNDLCALKNLGDLYVSQNGLNGTIPACLGGLKSLQRLFLDSNKLTSTIPSSIWSLKDLVLLNLSSNSLSGYLPSTIGTFKVLTLLDLSYNQLSGYIPRSIGGAQQLSSLRLSHNKFSGNIPESLGALLGLEILDLSENNLLGNIPKSLEKLRYLQYLNVSLNVLQGEIPRGGSFVNFTARSFMGNVALCGTPLLEVPLCRSKITIKSQANFLSLLKYILPFTVLALITAMIIIFLLRSRKRNIRPLTTGDSILVEWIRVSYTELLRATEYFNESNLLGTGGFGSVFKGTLSDGNVVAIKVLNLEQEGAMKSFKAECDVLQQIRHRNIVRIISSCTNLDFRALVLEYMTNGSLEKWLYSHNNYLDLSQRLNIMVDVGLALEYLHHGQGTPILHCDLKPSNILLDEDMVAHVGDFGLAKILGEEFMERTMTLATVGYMAPEYGREGLVSTRGDVYSYGIILMETFTRKKPTDEMFSDEISLRSWIEVAIHGSINDVVDINIVSTDAEHLPAKEQCLSSILSLALDCTTTIAAERPTIEDVVNSLQKIRAIFLKSLSG